MNFIAVVSPVFIFHVGYMGINSWVKLPGYTVFNRENLLCETLKIG